MTPASPSRADWRKSSYSGQDGNCVEVASGQPASTVLVRDTQDRDGCTLQVPPAAWHRFTRSIS